MKVVFPFCKAGFELLLQNSPKHFFEDDWNKREGCANSSRADNQIKHYPRFSESKWIIIERDTINPNEISFLKEKEHPDKKQQRAGDHQRHHEFFLMRVQARRDKSPHLVKHHWQRNHERGHEQNLDWHRKR